MELDVHPQSEILLLENLLKKNSNEHEVKTNNQDVYEHSTNKKTLEMERKIAELESIIAQANIIDVSKLSGKEIKFGATVNVIDEDTGQNQPTKLWGKVNRI